MRRHRFTEAMLELVMKDFVLITGDEAHFHLSGMVNQQNFHFAQLKIYNKATIINLEKLSESTTQEIQRIPHAMLERNMEHFAIYLQECLNKNGRHLTDVIFQNRLFFRKQMCFFVNGNIPVMYKNNTF